jgi:peptide-methionine (S)-S-oxide reductase
MSTDTTRTLPARPSKEHLRKEAKRLAKHRRLGLAEAQRQIAVDYGFETWAALICRVAALRGGQQPDPLPPLAAAAKAGDVAAVRHLLAEGAAVDEAPRGTGGALWQACASDASDEARLAIVDALLLAGANPRRDGAGETALHAAAARGPLALVERLIRGEALEWQPDSKGRAPLALARASEGRDKDAIIELLARPVIRDPSFRLAVTAIHQGDVAGLTRLLDAEPRLLRENIVEPECYRAAKRPQYFRDPRLFWFIADNPTLIERMPANMVEIARVMIERGVHRADLDYALELVMTSSPAREQGLQLPLVEVLMAAGATPTQQAIVMTLAHCELEPIHRLLAGGLEISAAIAAALGRTDVLPGLLARASAEEVQEAFGLAAINRQREAVSIALDHGADPNGYMPVHRHCLAVHQAVLADDLEFLMLLISHGARVDIPDKLWGSTPLGWAIHQGQPRTRAYLEEFGAAR